MAYSENTITECQAGLVGGIPTQQQKHLALHDAIESIKILKNRVDGLLSRIKNQPAGGEVDKDPNQKIEPSLETVLSHGPEDIRSACEEIYKTIEAIEQAIF